ncbi:hypothetical protein AKJ09_06838 [Labilithrix luteola]|uniref:Uncharacterized protein n=1 Tax=Labilithrix luteola TaxID=1391654 RepID=A0A0K1Q464_9BACT|nr:hypothetical protein [Labilithrix luteola]AKV00175.1 hypothetical protein AKJ09_06838 [Labilithrix luteola]
MGLYDQITVIGDWCRCSEGHDLRGEPLQTKDLGCTMGDWILAEDLRGEPGHHGDPVKMPLSGTLSAYTFCRECPSFLQRETWNVLSAWVEFEIDLDAGRLIAVWRISEPSADWIERERAAGSIGPMPLAQAVEECTARRERPR